MKHPMTLHSPGIKINVVFLYLLLKYFIIHSQVYIFVQ